MPGPVVGHHRWHAFRAPHPGPCRPVFTAPHRRAGLPAAHLAGAPRAPRIRFSGYLFIDGPDANATRARAYVAQGCDELKIKVGGDLDLDVRRLRAIRAGGPQGTGRFPQRDRFRKAESS